jgi:hypothetical protein
VDVEGTKFVWHSRPRLCAGSGKGSSAVKVRKTLFGREDVSGHGFNRVAKLLKMNNTTLPKACA